MKRKIYNDLLNWSQNKANRKPLMILGVRQCGKTYIIDKFCKENYKNYIYINLLEDNKIVELYNSNYSSHEKYQRLKMILQYDIEEENTVLFIDEIQECENLISELKYFCEVHNNINIICAGSLLGIKIKNMSSPFPVGKVKTLHLYPMDFEEFLWALNKYELINQIKICYKTNKIIGNPLHDILIELYKTYLISGGMPESISNIVKINLDYIKYDTTIISDIKEQYLADMSKHVKSEAETLKIKKVYNSLANQLSNPSNKFQYSKVDKKTSARDYETSLEWLINSDLVLKSYVIKKPEIPLEGFKDDEVFKLYLSDVGILVNMLNIPIRNIILNDIGLYKGVVTENYVATELVKNNIHLYYWQSNNTAEVDFVVQLNGKIVPIEVKSSDNTQSKSLRVYMEKYNPEYAIRLSTKDFAYNPETKIKSVPLYAVFCIKDDE